MRNNLARINCYTLEEVGFVKDMGIFEFPNTDIWLVPIIKKKFSEEQTVVEQILASHSEWVIMKNNKNVKNVHFIYELKQEILNLLQGDIFKKVSTAS